MTRLLMALCLLLLSFSSTAGIFTNGGGYSGDLDNVWFLGDDPVEYCVVIAKNFPLAHEQAREVVREALDEWIGFFHKHRLDALRFNGLTNREPVGISLDFKEVPECSSKRGQLKFLLGVQSKEVVQLMKSRRTSLGLSFREAFDHVRLRNGGTIFIQNWTLNRLRLKHLVLHELGHILGMTHNSLPIMLEFPADAFIDNSPLQNMMGLIEAPTWRYRLNDGDVIPFTDGGEGGSEMNLLLPMMGQIFGFSPTGRHTLKLHVAQDMTGEWTLRLEAREEGTGKHVVMSGYFEIRKAYVMGPTGISGPVLFSDWKTGDAERGVFERRHLDNRPRNVEADGAFYHEGKTYPAVLEARPGVLLRIFVPQENRWWSVQDYAAVAIWSATRQLSN